MPASRATTMLSQGLDGSRPSAGTRGALPEPPAGASARAGAVSAADAVAFPFLCVVVPLEQE